MGSPDGPNRSCAYEAPPTNGLPSNRLGHAPVVPTPSHAPDHLLESRPVLPQILPEADQPGPFPDRTGGENLRKLLRFPPCSARRCVRSDDESRWVIAAIKAAPPSAINVDGWISLWLSCIAKKSRGWDSNPQPNAYEAFALPLLPRRKRCPKCPLGAKIGLCGHRPYKEPQHPPPALSRRNRLSDGPAALLALAGPGLRSDCSTVELPRR